MAGQEKKGACQWQVVAGQWQMAAAAIPRSQLEALEWQQQRIQHRTQVINYMLVADQRNGAALTVGDVLTELLHDITEAARTIGTILHDMRHGTPVTISSR